MEKDMTTQGSTKSADGSFADDLLHLARYYLVSRAAFVVLAIVAALAGVALNWGWLVAAGIAPVLLTGLPWLGMGGLGLCMTKMVGGSCAPKSAQSAPAAEPVQPPGRG